jgi:hypothetical protein
VNSKGETDNSYSNAISAAYSLGYQNAFKKGFLFAINAGLNKAGASKEYYGVNYNWTLQYATARVGIGYQINKWRIKPYVLASPYYSFLLKANQTTNDENIDMKQNKSIKAFDYGLMGTAGLKIRFSDYIGIYTAFNYIYGLENIEMSANQKLYNRAFSVTLGVSATITKSTAKWLQEKK